MIHSGMQIPTENPPPTAPTPVTMTATKTVTTLLTMTATTILWSTPTTTPTPIATATPTTQSQPLLCLLSQCFPFGLREPYPSTRGSGLAIHMSS